MNTGEFKNFPYFNTFRQISLTPRQANLLSNLASWVMRNHLEDVDAGRSVVVDVQRDKQVQPPLE